MSEEPIALDAVSRGLLGRSLATIWERLGPLSAGAVASSVAIVGARGLLRRVLGKTAGRAVGLLAVASLVPLGIWWLSEPPATRAKRQALEKPAGPREGIGDNGEMGSSESGDDGR